MALIKCPECGKEVSDTAISCPNCGFQIRDYSTQNKYHKSNKCANEKTGDESFDETGYMGKKNLACPTCGNKNVRIQNGIPGIKIFSEMASFGTVTPMTKKEYRGKMKYVCKECGAKWAENPDLITPETEKTIKLQMWMPISIGIISLLLGFVIIYIVAESNNMAGNMLQLIYGVLLILGGIILTAGGKSLLLTSIACASFGISVIVSGIMTITLNSVFIFCVVTLMFFALTCNHRDKLKKM